MQMTASSRPYRTATRSSLGRTSRRSTSARERRDSGLHAALCAAVVAALIVAVIFAAAVSGHRSGGRAAATQIVKIDAGDSLWSIAAAHPVPGLSTAQTVELIKRSNQLSGSSVAEGTLLRVPSDRPSSVALAR